ncbi:MAG: hypothetical protein ABI270_03535 [Nitrosospira sp.]
MRCYGWTHGKSHDCGYRVMYFDVFSAAKGEMAGSKRERRIIAGHPNGISIPGTEREADAIRLDSEGLLKHAYR